MSRVTELRYATGADAREGARLDEIVGRGFVHLEDLGDAWLLDVAGVRCSMYLRPKTFREWWDDVRFYGWWGRSEWFVFHRIVLRADEVNEGPVDVSVDGVKVRTLGPGPFEAPMSLPEALRGLP